MHAITHLQARFVSNDLCFVDPTAGLSREPCFCRVQDWITRVFILHFARALRTRQDGLSSSTIETLGADCVGAEDFLKPNRDRAGCCRNGGRSERPPRNAERTHLPCFLPRLKRSRVRQKPGGVMRRSRVGLCLSSTEQGPFRLRTCRRGVQPVRELASLTANV